MSGKAKLASKKKPRYLELADKLRQEVLRGDYSDPGNFPTETVLCKKFAVSRFTVREALRQLTGEGLISRKRGSGTIVQPASARAGTLHQPLSNVGEILQYALDTKISFEPRAPQELPVAIAEQVGVKPQGEWFVIHGKRHKAGRKRPVALTIAWIHPELADTVQKIDYNGATLFGQIEHFENITVTRVTQDIQAVSAFEEVAEGLGVEDGDPVLRILRCYFDEKDRLFEISENYHPGDRFAYSMHIEVN
tara:strand:+ start:25571 stop:26320 length:750 start_codon:yes stop_codon:yes gene_type:complete